MANWEDLAYGDMPPPHKDDDKDTMERIALVVRRTAYIIDENKPALDAIITVLNKTKPQHPAIPFVKFLIKFADPAKITSQKCIDEFERVRGDVAHQSWAKASPELKQVVKIYHEVGSTISGDPPRSASRSICSGPVGSFLSDEITPDDSVSQVGTNLQSRASGRSRDSHRPKMKATEKDERGNSGHESRTSTALVKKKKEPSLLRQLFTKAGGKNPNNSHRSSASTSSRKAK